MTGGAVIGQAINFATTLLIARLYSPSDIGLLTAILAIAMTLSPLVTLGLQVAIVPARTDGEALQLARLALLSTTAGAVVVALIMALAPLPSNLLNQHHSLAATFIPAMLFVTGSFTVLSQVAVRQRLYGAIATRGVVQSSTIGSIQVGGYLTYSSGLWLFAGEFLGRAVGTASLIPQYLGFRRENKREVPPLGHAFKRYSDAWRFFLPATTLEMAAGQVGVLLVVAWFGTTDAGYLGLATRVLSVPIVLVGTAVGQVLNSELARRRRLGNTERSKQRLRQLMLGLGLISGAISLLLFLFAPWAFSVAFGEEWRQAGELARFLGLPTAVGLIWHPLSVVFSSYLKLHLFLILSALRLLLSVAFGVILWLAGQDWITVVVGMAVGIAIIQLIGIRIAWRVVLEDQSPPEKPTSHSDIRSD